MTISSWVLWVVILGNIAGGYFLVTQLLRGAGMITAGLAGLLFGALAWFFPAFGVGTLIVLAMAGIGSAVWQKKLQKDIAHSQLVFEGGGVRRGLTPVEVGTLFEISTKGLLVVSITTLLQKGILKRTGEGDSSRLRVNPEIQAGKEIINPTDRTVARKKAAREHGQVLSPEEDMLLELFWQQIEPSSDVFPFQIWADKAAQECETKLGGYDRSQSVMYYHNYMAHRFEGVGKGFFSQEEYVPWMVLDVFAHTHDSHALREMMQKTRPAWLRAGESLFDWAASFDALKS